MVPWEPYEMGLLVYGATVSVYREQNLFNTLLLMISQCGTDIQKTTQTLRFLPRTNSQIITNSCFLVFRSVLDASGRSTVFIFYMLIAFVSLMCLHLCTQHVREQFIDTNRLDQFTDQISLILHHALDGSRRSDDELFYCQQRYSQLWQLCVKVTIYCENLYNNI